MKLFLPAIIFILFAFGCKSKSNLQGYYQPENAKVFSDSLSFTYAGEATFPLDSTSVMTSNSVQLFYDRDSNAILSTLNPMENEIENYNYSTKTLISKVPLYHEGLNSIDKKSGRLAHLVISKDSIFLCNQLNFRGYLVNSKGELLRKYVIADSVRRYGDFGIPYANTEKPMFCYNNKIYMMGSWGNPHAEDHTNYHIVLVLDLATGKITRELPKPAVYNLGNWGSNYLYMNVYGTFNTKNHHFVYSFAADPYLHEMVDSVPVNYIAKWYAGSKYFTSINAYSEDREMMASKEESVKFDFTHSSFCKIIYNPFNDLYYRYSFLGIPDSELDNLEKRYNRQETIIILNSHFKKVGEYTVARNRFQSSDFFLTKEGLHLLLKPNIQKSPDSMTYIIFKPVKIIK